MSKNFKECAANGGKVVVKRLKGGKTIKICYDSDGKSHTSKVRPKKQNKERFTKPTEDSLNKLKEHFNGDK